MMTTAAARSVWMSIAVLLLHTAVAQPLQLLCLSNAPATPRFTVPAERTWPATNGQAEICLWDDDRMAAVSITIDDNQAADQAWWHALGVSSGVRFTWFVITGRVGQDGSTWPGFAALAAAGHCIGSHSVTHYVNTNPPWPGIVWEYHASRTNIEDMVQQPALTMAYANGYVPPNDRMVAAQFYAAVRGVVGEPNRANLIDYLNTKSVSRTSTLGREYLDAVQFGTSSVSWLNNVVYKRGWLCAHYHSVPDANRPGAASSVHYLASQSNDLWTARFDDIIKYGQERDTAKLTVLTNTPQRVSFSLSDDMYDAWYDYPLTIKLRLYAQWTNPVAVHAGRRVPLRSVTTNGAAFALLRVVPDRGVVHVMDRAADSDGDGVPDWSECIAGTDPDSAADWLQVRARTLDVPIDHVELRWNSVAGRVYDVSAASHPTGVFTLTSLTNLAAVSPENVVTSALLPGGRTFFHVRVRSD